MNGFVFMSIGALDHLSWLPKIHRVEPDWIRKEICAGLDDELDTIKPDADQVLGNDSVQNDVEEGGQFWLLVSEQ